MDEKINQEMFTIWKKWLEEVSRIDLLKIPRTYILKTSKEIHHIELHCFCDASNKAYCSVVYFRFCLNDGSFKVSLVYSKARVNPKSVKSGKLSIPKLELMAAVLGVRIVQIILSESTINFKKIVYWTDSSTVMIWLQNRKKLPVFESNRIKLILQYSKEEDWRWLSTKVNIADIGTRDNTINLTSDCEWFHGPKFLYEKKKNGNILLGNMINY